MPRTLLRGVLKEALEHIPITKNDLIGVTQKQTHKGQKDKANKRTK